MDCRRSAPSDPLPETHHRQCWRRHEAMPSAVSKSTCCNWRGRRYELLDGVLVASPRPTTVHRFVAPLTGRRTALVQRRAMPRQTRLNGSPVFRCGISTGVSCNSGHPARSSRR